MPPTSSNHNTTPGTNYVNSLRDPVKRRYAAEYLSWIKAGRTTTAPSRGALSMTHWKAICANLDALG